MQERIDTDGRAFREFLCQNNKELPEDFRRRMGFTAFKKIRHGQTATLVHRQIGRNEPCPCGSGKKFKKCCIDKCNQGEFEVEQKVRAESGK